ncbi:hypothetical protein AVEN_39298-1 [Araneus ventricosus]|uniref:Uncharacterized protein n=1 Tax=Araneus ventricosus TaxID=182803 RepID=A0A4Y2Q1R8_ARAVE|nr:hypothetical protein AVEN_39298-1 [Araneus ventricosus]
MHDPEQLLFAALVDIDVHDASGNIVHIAESDNFLENKENFPASSVKYNKCLLKFKPQVWNFSYMFRDYDTFSVVWLNAQNAADTPVNDLMLWEPMNLYEKCEPGVVKPGLLTFSSFVVFDRRSSNIFFLFSKKV